MNSDFFQMFQHCDGQIEIRCIAKGQKPIRQFVDIGDLNQINKLCQRHKDTNIYIGIATRDAGGGAKDNIVNFPALWADIDFKETPRDEFAKRLETFPHRPSIAVFSGGGYHLYWMLKEPAEKAATGAVEDYNRRIAHALGGDPASTDAARCLRVPGTLNHKYNPPRTVHIRKVNDFAYELDDFDILLPAADTSPSIHTKEPADLGRCAFIQWCKENPDQVSEPLWYALISNLICIRPMGRTLVHNYSRGYPDYSPKETDQKILHALDAPGPHTCRYIQQHGFRSCPSCGVKAPIGRINQGSFNKWQEQQVNNLSQLIASGHMAIRAGPADQVLVQNIRQWEHDLNILKGDNNAAKLELFRSRN